MQQFFYGGSGGSGQSVQKPKQVPYRRNENRPSLSKPSYISEIKKRLADIPEGCSEEQAMKWGFFYTIIATEDHDSPISVKRIRDFVEEQVRIKDSDLYERIIAFLNMVEVTDFALDDKKIIKKVNSLATAVAKFKTIANAYEYSQGVHDAIEAMAPKLEAPDDVDTVTKAKWLRLWAIIRDQGLFQHEYSDFGEYVTLESIEKSNKSTFNPEDMIYYAKNSFDGFEANDFILERIEALIGLYPVELQNSIKHFAELDNSEFADTYNVGEVRNGIIRQMFPTRWITATDFFILRRGLENVMPEYLNFALAAAEKGLNSFETEQQKGYSPFTLKLEPFTIYKIGSCFNPQTKQVGDVYVSGTYELQMLIETYKWIDKHPDFAFGFDKKTIAEYEKEGVITKLKFEKLVEAWIMSMGLVNSEKDINWEVANMIFKPEKFETIMVDFFKGEASQDDVFQKVGFVDRTQAITCLNLKANIGEAEKRRMLDSLRKVKMFKVKNSSPYYLIYVMLFGYLKNHGSKLLKEDDLRKYSDLIPLVA